MKEPIEITLLVVGVALILVVSYFLFTSAYSSKSSFQTEEHQYEVLGEASKNLFYTKIPYIDKTLAQLIGDRFLQDSDTVYYGQDYGSVNVREVVDNYFTNYFKKNWKFSVYLKSDAKDVLWIPDSIQNSPDGNYISKVNSGAGNEIGRYRTVPEGAKGNPSRVVIDSKGNVWVGNRATRTIVKVGLLENGQCVDRNGNGVIETSRDANMNGAIDPNEIMPFSEDECILKEVILGDPPYDVGGLKNGVRAVCKDRSGNIYAGLYNDKKLFNISSNGDIQGEWNLNYRIYGCSVDINNNLWISVFDSSRDNDQTGVFENNDLVKLDSSTGTFSEIEFDACGPYSLITSSKKDYLITVCWGKKTNSGRTPNRLIKINTTTNEIIFDLPLGEDFENQFAQGRGIAIDKNENIYVVYTTYSYLVKYDKDGNVIKIAKTCENPTGVGIDKSEKIWVTCLDSYIARHDSDLNQELISAFGTSHYVYNYFTSYDVDINPIERFVEFGYDYSSKDRVRTFNVEIPIPGLSGRYANGILYVWES